MNIDAFKSIVVFCAHWTSKPHWTYKIENVDLSRLRDQLMRPAWFQSEIVLVDGILYATQFRGAGVICVGENMPMLGDDLVELFFLLSLGYGADEAVDMVWIEE